MKKTTGGRLTNPQLQFPFGEDEVDAGQTSRERNSIQETGGEVYSPVVTSTGGKKRKKITTSEEISSESTKVDYIPNSGNQPDQQPEGAVGGVTDNARSLAADAAEIVTSAADAKRIKTSASETDSEGKKPDETLLKALASKNQSTNQQTASEVDRLKKEAEIMLVAKKSCMEHDCTKEEVDEAAKRLMKREELDR